MPEYNLNYDNLLQYNDKKYELKHLLDEKIKVVLLKSTVCWAEKGEHSTQYYLNLEQSNAFNKNITKLK